MKIPNKISTLTIAALLVVGLSTGCQNNSATQNNAVNQTVNKALTNANQNINQANKSETNTTVNTTKSESNSTTLSSATTPSAAYKAAYAARKNKDIKALKQLISKDMFEFFEILGDGKPNAVDEGLKEMCETPQGATDESRNEKITGDKATLEYIDQNGAWKTMDLVKEDGVWKLTIAKMDDDKKSK